MNLLNMVSIFTIYSGGFDVWSPSKTTRLPDKGDVRSRGSDNAIDIHVFVFVKSCEKHFRNSLRQNQPMD